MLLAVLSGVLLILCFPKADLGPLAFVALAPFLRSFPYERSRAALGYGFLCGFVFFSGLLYWVAVFTSHVIGALGVLAWLGLAGVQAAYIALLSLCANLLWKRTGPLGRLFLLPSLWTLIEWLRQLGSLGMGWGDLAYTQWHFLPLLQIAPVAGCWGISWVTVFLNAALAMPSRKTLAVAGAIAFVVLLWGFVRFGRSQPESARPFLRAAAIQGNINEDVPWHNGRPASPAYFENTMATFGQMIASASKSGANLCVLAETALPGYLRYDVLLRGQVTRWAVANNTALAAGGEDMDPRTGKDTNSLFVVTPTGEIAGSYAKQELVPFGEYVPYRSYLPFLEALHVAIFDDEPGGPSQPPILVSPYVGKVGSAICYESTYPRFLRQQTLAGANVLDVITDDTWFGRTAAARQHLAMSAIRAAETHRYLVRCAATGISAIFGPEGNVINEAPLFTRAVVSAPIAPLHDLTFFVRYGDWFIGLCALIVIGVLVRKRSQPSTE
ncbi:MAG TPA: apolipoprotein N-acyltransferase [Capsulimonadaceae bacterium]|nr:apolipoprotein N-acyltransferase [Capsulimonadaceae bacterium]